MGLRLAEPADRWGTPLYALDLDRASANLARVRAALPGALIAYAVKANSDPQLLRRLVREGAGCEVVTAAELALAVRAGCPPDRMVMNGVGKTDAEATEALRLSVLVNAESLDELRALVRLGIAGGRIGLRVNPGLATTTHPHLATGGAESKFGIPLEAVASAMALAREAGTPIASIGAHVGSGIDDAAVYRALASRLAPYDVPLLDLGGGWASVEMAVAVGDAAAGRSLIVEPGRSIVADAGWLVTRVVRVQPRDGMAYLVADAGMSELLRPVLYDANHAVSLVRAGETWEPPVTTHLAGPVCEAGDVLARDIGRWLDPSTLRRAGPGALLAVERVGAYGAAMASVYNGRPRPAEVVLESGQARLSRRRETLDDLVSRDV